MKAPPPDEVDWLALSPEGLWTVEHIAIPVAEGATQAQVARDLGVSSRTVGLALRDLAAEIVEQVASNGRPP